MSDLYAYHVAILAADGFEEAELVEPMRTLQEADAVVTVVSLQPGRLRGYRDGIQTIEINVGRTIDHVSVDDFDAVHLPGGLLNALTLRPVPAVQRFLRGMQKAGKPFSAISHAPWELVSANLVRGRKLTGFTATRDEIRDAGGEWVDAEVVQNGNWVTSRLLTNPWAFNGAMVELFSRSAVTAP